MSDQIDPEAAAGGWAYEYLEEGGAFDQLPEWARTHQGALARSYGRDAYLNGAVIVLASDDMPGRRVVIS